MTQAPFPFNRLPTELIRRIFERVAQSDHAGDYELEPSCPLYLSDSRIAVCLSHVCATWRTIALGMPSLWVAPTFTYKLDGIDFEILDRAQDLDISACLQLDIYSEDLDTVQNEQSKWIERFLPKMTNVRRLGIYDSIDHKFILWLLANAPRLETLFSAYPCQDFNMEDGEDEIYVPVLNNLSITLNQHCRLSTLLICNITRFEMEGYAPTPEKCGEVLKQLHRMPRLKELVFQFVGVEEVREDWQDIDLNEIQLPVPVPYTPHLSGITFMGDCVMALMFYRHLSPIQPLRLHFIEMEGELPNIVTAMPFLIPFLAELFTQPAFAPVRMVFEKSNHKFWCTRFLSAAGSTVSISMVHPIRRNWVSIGFDHRWSTFLHALNYHAVDKVQLDTAQTNLAAMICEILAAKCPALKAFHIVSDNCASALRAMIPPHVTADSFPMLQKLVVDDATLFFTVPRVHDKAGGVLPKCEDRAYTPLLNMLQRRAENSLPIQKLVLRHCRFGTADRDQVVARLHSYAEAVDVLSSMN